MQIGTNELSPNFPLSATRREQRELSGKLTIKPLFEIIGSSVNDILHKEEAKSTVTDPVFAPFFNPDASDRKYYQDGDTLVVKEDIQGSKIYSLAVFEKSEVKGGKNPGVVTFHDDFYPGQKISYLQLKNFCLVKKDGEQAIDLAAPWLSQPPDGGVTKRRIGLLQFNQPLSSEKQAEAVVRTNSILLADAQEDDAFRAQYTLGAENIPSTSKWLGAILAGVKSTQKEADIANKNLFDLAKQTLPKIARDIEELLQKDDSQRSELLWRTFQILKNLISTTKPEFLQILMLRYVTGRLSKETLKYEPVKSTIVEPEAQKIGFQILRRLERNVAASGLYFIRQLRQAGFDLFPGVSSTQLIQTMEEIILTSYNKTYPRAAEYGISFTSTGNVNTFVTAMRLKYDEMKVQPGFEEQFINEFVSGYEEMRRSAQPSVSANE